MMDTSSPPGGNGQDATAAAQPLWLPPGVTFSSLPKPVQQAVLAILNPIYEEQVLGATDPLERGQGLSYCNLLFFELMTTCGVLQWAADETLYRMAISKGLAALVNVSSQKNRIANFLLALQKFRAKAEPADAEPPGESQPSE